MIVVLIVLGIILLGVVTLNAQNRRSGQDRRSDGETTIREKVRFWSLKNGLSPALVWGVVMTESSGNPAAENPSDPSTGLMQVTPLIGRAFAGLPGDTQAVLKALLDPDINLQAGTGFLAVLQKKYSGKFPQREWVQAYNLGEPQFNRGKRNQVYGDRVMKFMADWDR